MGPWLGLGVVGLVVSGQGRAAGPEAPEALRKLVVAPPPVELTAEQDGKRLMALLGIASLGPDADGRSPQAPNAANYEEAKANPFPNLPDPLRQKRGGRVMTAHVWWDKRRPEIVEDFDREIYGRVRRGVPTGTTTETAAGMPVVTKQLLGHLDKPSYPPVSVDIQLTLTTPARATGSVPVMLQFGFNFAAGVRPGSRGPSDGSPTWQEQLIDFVGSPGAGGAKPHRRTYGDLVENIAGAGDYHWVAGKR